MSPKTLKHSLHHSGFCHLTGGLGFDLDDPIDVGNGGHCTCGAVQTFTAVVNEYERLQKVPLIAQRDSALTAANTLRNALWNMVEHPKRRASKDSADAALVATNWLAV